VNRALVERAQRGDRDAFSSLAIELSDRLFGVAHRILRDFDSASDALQVALVRIWRDLPGLRDPDLLESWSYRVLINACHDELRRARRFRPEIRGVRLEHMSVADPYGSVADRESLERAFRKLPVDQRAAIVLQHYRQLTMPEIAIALGVPVGTVRSRLHYARKTLRAAIEADDRPPTRKERSA
jgi:RNA polymerase sigma-70 factor (ECF subfamily)